MEPKQLLDEFKKIVDPIAADAKKALETAQTTAEAVAKIGETIDAKVAAQLTAVATGKAELKDANGKVVPFARGEHIRDNKAPAFVRPEGLGDKPLTLSMVCRGFRDSKHEPLVKHVSDELALLGHLPSTGGNAVMFPMSSDALVIGAVENQRADNLVKLLQHALPVVEDMDEARYIAKHFAGQGSVRAGWAQKAMDMLDETAGGALVPLPGQGELLELLRAATVIGRAGAEQISLPPQGSMRWPKETGQTTFQWLGSNDTISDSSPTTNSMTLTAKRIGGLVKIPNDLLRYGLGAEGLVRRALTLDAGLAEDLAFLEGQGGNNIPLGIIRYPRSTNDTPTADSVTLHTAKTVGTDGDTFEPEDPLKMIGLVEEAPDQQGATGFVMRPLMFVGLANKRADAITAADAKGPFLFNVMRESLSGGAPAKVLNGLPVYTSTQVNKTSRKGTGTALSYVICANWRRAVVARVGAVELAASEHAGFAADQTWIRAILRTEFQLKYPQGFVITPVLLIP